MPSLAHLVKVGIMAQSYPLFFFKTIDSTQSKIKLLINEDRALADFTTVVAGQQLQGRGRGVSVWQDSAGKSASMSVFVRWPQPLRESFEVNRWVCHCLGAILPKEVRFKWPNDLMVGPRKLGGMLIENHWGSMGIRSSVIGIGINAKSFEGMPERAVSLEELGMDIEPMEVVDVVVRTFQNQKPAIQNTKLLERRYASLLWGKQDFQAYELASGDVVMARVQGVDVQGKLLLEIQGKKNVQAFDLDAVKWINPY